MNKPKVRVAYGAGGALAGLLAEGTERFDWIVDDTPGYAGQNFAGCAIRGSAELASFSSEMAEIVVCAQTSSASKAIAKKLEQMGFRQGKDFSDSSIIAVRSMERRLSRLLKNPFEPSLLQRMERAVGTIDSRNLSGIAGSWLFSGLVETVVGDAIPGAIAEAGVYQGGNAIASLHCSPALRNRPYYLLDSFAGLVKTSSLDPDSRAGEFADANVKVLRTALVDFPNTIICQGYFDQTLPKLSDQHFALAYIDCDLADPARFCMEWFWDRLSPGGFLLIHDYWFPEHSMPKGAPEPFRGIKAIADPFVAAKRARYAVLPETTHLVIRKD